MVPIELATRGRAWAVTLFRKRDSTFVAERSLYLGFVPLRGETQDQGRVVSVAPSGPVAIPVDPLFPALSGDGAVELEVWRTDEAPECSEVLVVEPRGETALVWREKE